MNQHMPRFVAMIQHHPVRFIGIADICPVKLRQTIEINKEALKQLQRFKLRFLKISSRFANFVKAGYQN